MIIAIMIIVNSRGEAEMTNVLITAAATLAMAATALTSAAAQPAGAKNVVLVHGGFVDGSGGRASTIS